MAETKYMHTEVKWKTLKDICVNITSGGTPLSTYEGYYKGDIPWLRTQEVDWNDVYDTEIKITEEAVRNSSAKLIPPNCVIIAMYGATAAKSCINKIPLTTNQACCNLQVNEKLATYKYVYYWIRFDYEKLKALGAGGQANISGEIIKNYRIPLPPLTEQRAIASTLTSIDNLIASLDKQIAKTQSVKQGAMQQLLTRLNTEDVKYEYFHDVCLFVRGVTYNKEQEISVKGDGYNILRANNITLDTNTLNFEDVKVVSRDVRVKEEQFLHKDDILMCAGSGSKEHVGKVAYVDKDIDYALGGFMAVIRTKTNLNSKFLFYILTSNSFKDYLDQAISCCTINNINSSMMRDFLIPIPSIETQHRIASALTAIDDQISALEAKRRKYEMVKVGMMQQLLTGKIRLK